MKLYHGTNGQLLENILRHGLRPRGQRKGNWRDNPSHPQCVYLTDSYAPYFGMVCHKGKSCAVIEVDTDKLDLSQMLPDEDAVEQSGRGHDDIPARGVRYRTRTIRRNLVLNYLGSPEAWGISLKILGTCAHYGTIPPEAITRALRWPIKGNTSVILQGWDPTISLLNQRIFGDSYRAKTALLFGDKPVTETDLWGKPHTIPEIVDLERFGF